MSMSKKDYVGVAHILRVWEAAEAAGVNVGVADVTKSLASHFGRSNEDFDRDRFMALARSKSEDRRRRPVR